MQARPIRHRRGRRTDLMGILRLLAGAEQAVPVPDRNLLHRFRRIVSDLGNDLYVAVVDEQLVGFVQISYRRHITLGLRGRVDALIVDEKERTREIAASLIALVAQRARRRGCRDVRYAVDDGSAGMDEVLVGSGWIPADRELRLDLSDTSERSDFKTD